jgi:hypothetical protein
MAKLYLLRYGTGDSRIASSFGVSAADVRRFYANTRVHSSDSLPTLNTDEGPASSVSNPQVTVIELFSGESRFGDFRSPGFNILLDVDPSDAYKQLVEKANT